MVIGDEKMGKHYYCPYCGETQFPHRTECVKCHSRVGLVESKYDSTYYQEMSQKRCGDFSQWYSFLLQEIRQNPLFNEDLYYGSEYKQATSKPITKPQAKEKVEDEATRQAKAIKEIESKKANSGKNTLISALVSIGSLGLAFGVAYLRIEFLIWVCIIASAIGFVAFLGFLGEWRTYQMDLALVRRNFKEYEKKCEKVAEQNAFYQAGQKAEWERTHPVCPSCGSRNTSRIGNINRAASVATWGLASSKIGKQYECKNCKHKW